MTDARPRERRTGLRTADYDFALPPDRIAQRPAARRDESRLMAVDRASGAIAHHAFRDLGRFLAGGDAIVLNTTRVFRARLLGQRRSGADAEVFLLRELDADRWEAMVQPGSKLKPGRVVSIAPGFDVEVLDATPRGTRVVRLRTEGTGASTRAAVHAAIAAHGHVPLPPYIERTDAADDAERYQTVFAREEGSVAAPTAGLHFTPELLAALEANGVRRAEVLLHVGAGTFKPVEVEDPAEHVMHEEWYQVPEGTATMLREVRAHGGRICAVGTTALRTLETAIEPGGGGFRAGSGETRIFIRPPARPRGADLLVTNFHLPRSTLLMLVAAMAGYELTMHAYDVAVHEGYRFYSYGDAMLIHG
jgi:S-adenosylmethionine:tRNA ribosyltransferase-isomerase